MPLELRHEGVVMRVDGDVLEIFQTGAGRGSDRVLLSWLAVRVLPAYNKGYLVIEIRSTADVVPLYEVAQKARSITTVTKLGIKIEDEPIYRQFFAQVAPLCGRPVVP